MEKGKIGKKRKEKKRGEGNGRREIERGRERWKKLMKNREKTGRNKERRRGKRKRGKGIREKRILDQMGKSKRK